MRQVHHECKWKIYHYARKNGASVKVVADEATGKILGAQMMCARATDMIGEFVTAITNGLTVEQMLRGMRSHPTYNEGIGEALEELEGGAVHVVPRKKKINLGFNSGRLWIPEPE